MKRIMCIWLPGWPLQRLSLEKPELKKQTLVIFEDSGRGKFQIVACSRRALKMGVRPGIPKAEAEALLHFAVTADTPQQNASRPTGPQDGMREGCLSSSSDPHFEPYDPEADRNRLRDLAVWCRRFSPVVGVEDADRPECLLINLEGITHLFKNERAMARHVLDELQKVRIFAKVAIADTVGMAWAATHYGMGRPGPPSKQNHPVLIPAGDGRTVLQSLPVGALRLPEAVVETLAELDLRHVRQLFKLPKSTLPSRFGDVLHKRIDQALGEIAEPITPELPPRPTIERWQFEYVISDRRVIEMAIERLLTRTLHSLEADRHGIQRAHILLQGELGELTDFTVGLIRPTASLPHLMRLVKTQLETVTTPNDICEITVELISSAPLDPRQETLFACRDETKARRERDQLFERMSSRLGEEAVMLAHAIPDPQPERAFRFEPVTRGEVLSPTENKSAGWSPPNSGSTQQQADSFEQRTQSVSVRPLNLKREVKQIDVVTVSGHSPPYNVRWHGRVHPVVKSWGPERIHTGWWRDANTVRDYYRIETDQGVQLWVFQNVQNGEWFLHGVFN
ncbi:MAG: DNA polymerase Y family protein [Planctomycetaceae bacterium]